MGFSKREEKILRLLFLIDKLKWVFYLRIGIGFIFIILGILIGGSISLALFGLGLMFLLDGEAILRECFNKSEINSKEKMSKKSSNLKINILGIYLLLILCLFIFVGVKIYIDKPEDRLIFSLIIIFCSGGIGGTLYAIRGFYQNLGGGSFNFEKWVWWYIFRPVMSAVIGVFVYFLILGGLLSIGNISEINYSKGLMFYSAMAFLAGFSFTQFANKLEEIASTIFAKKEKK